MRQQHEPGLDLVMRDVCATLSGKQILHNVSAVVKQGTMIAIMGSSGEYRQATLLFLNGTNFLHASHFLRHIEMIVRTALKMSETSIVMVRRCARMKLFHFW